MITEAEEWKYMLENRIDSLRKAVNHHYDRSIKFQQHTKFNPLQKDKM